MHSLHKGKIIIKVNDIMTQNKKFSNQITFMFLELKDSSSQSDPAGSHPNAVHIAIK